MHSVQSTGDGGHMDKDDELVASTPSQRNYKGILIALIVICAVCGLIGLSIQLLRPPDDGPRVKGRKVTLGDISSRRFQKQPFNGTWISANEILFRDSLGGVSTFSTTTFTSTPLVTNTTFRQLNANKYSVSADKKFVLLIHDVRVVWEHSHVAKYDIYDIGDQFKISLTPFGETTKNVEDVELQYAEWGQTENELILVYKNDIYYKESVNSNRTIRITNSGQPGVIFNGIPDWLYEVQILKSRKALWMSPDGKTMLYASFNDSLVGEVYYALYGESAPYPKLRRWRYPKAGTTNPEVTLFGVKLNSNSSDDFRPVPIKPPSGVDSRDHYITSVQWVQNDEVSVIWMNRIQNTAIFTLCNSKKWKCRDENIYTLRPSKIKWLDFPQAPFYSKDMSKCLLRVPWRDGDAGYFHHVIWLDIETRKEIPITCGPYEVTQISAWDQQNQFIYFIAVPEGKPGERHLYRTTERSSNSTTITAPLCLTCSMSVSATAPSEPIGSEFTFPAKTADSWNISANDPNKPSCLYNKVTFNPTNEFFVRECLGPGVPTATLHTAPSGGLLFVLNANTGFKNDVAKLGLPQVKTFRVQLSGGYMAPTRLFLPPGFRENEEFKFPLLLHISGAPGSQLVSEKFRISWVSYLTSQKNFIVVEVDGRGTGFQGEKFRQTVYRNLGVQEVTDQLDVIRFYPDKSGRLYATWPNTLPDVYDITKCMSPIISKRLHFSRYLKENLSFIDEKNMAVWGWGYGGHLTLLTMAQDVTKLFQCGIAVAPITKWEYYDTVYTERYLGLPNMTENVDGYEKGNIVRIVKKLKGRKVLIIHGTADEKVHYQHTLHLTKAFIKDGLPFTEQIYPDEGHGFHGVTDHLYKTMDTFLDQTFEKPDWEDWEKANFLGITI